MAKATCPSCGAMGEVGKECEYCGTLIPIKRKRPSGKKAMKERPKKENEEQESRGSSWDDVCPENYMPCTRITDDDDSIYMVVENRNDSSYQGIIDREGKFVKGPDYITYQKLFSDNNELIFNNDTGYQLLVLATGKNYVLGKSIDLSLSRELDESYRYIVIVDIPGWATDRKRVAIFDRSQKKLIPLSCPISSDYKLLDKVTKDSVRQYILGNASKEKLTLTIENGKAIVDGQNPAGETNSDAQEETEKSGCGCSLQAIVIIAIIAIMGAFFVFSDLSSDIGFGNTAKKESRELTKWKNLFRQEFVGKEYASDNILEKNYLKIRILDDNTLQYQTGRRETDMFGIAIKWDDPKTVRYTLAIKEDGYNSTVRWTFDDYISDDFALYVTKTFSSTFHIKKNDGSNYAFMSFYGVELSGLKQEKEKWEAKFEQDLIGEEFVCNNYGKERLKFKIIDKTTLSYQTGTCTEYPYADDIEWSNPQRVQYKHSVEVGRGKIAGYQVDVTLKFAHYESRDLWSALNTEIYSNRFTIKDIEDTSKSYDFEMDKDND